jgi:hypothetical protein
MDPERHILSSTASAVSLTMTRNVGAKDIKASTKTGGIRL